MWIGKAGVSFRFCTSRFVRLSANLVNGFEEFPAECLSSWSGVKLFSLKCDASRDGGVLMKVKWKKHYNRSSKN